ncbi:quinolinate synthase NadA [bacterium]|nr:quinolinate synthase NadA [bacterium]
MFVDIDNKNCSFEKNQKLVENIRRLKKERNAIILTHNYQRPEIQDIGDHCGDSLGLCRIAASSNADVICFCGVRFMAESAAILNPGKKVILPAPEAGCSLADDLSIETLRTLKSKYPNAAVVCYVNSSAGVKAESDICCTSANAVQVVNSLKDYEEVLFVPDHNLGHYVSLHTDKKVYLAEVYCNAHHDLEKADAVRLKKLHPNAKFIAHPECKPEVLELADFVSSTSGMSKYVGDSGAREFIVGTEIGMVYRLQKDFPEYLFYPVSDKMICNDMKLITLERLAYSLETLTPVVEVPEKIRLKAKQALDRMMKIK